MAVFFGSAEVQGSLSNSSNGTGFNLHNQAALGAINELSPAQQEEVRRQGAEATMWAFVSILPFLGLALVASAALGNVWISKREKNAAAVVEQGQGEKKTNQQAEQAFAAAGSGGEVLTGVYLVALLTGTVKSKRRPAAVERKVEEVRSPETERVEESAKERA